MKALILLAVLSAPAFAGGSIKVFGDWKVISDNGAQVMTATPTNSSDRIFSMACTYHAHCFVSYTVPSLKCNTSISNHLRATANYHSIESPFDCKDHEWVQSSSDFMKVIKLNLLDAQAITINLPDYPNTKNTYRTNGFAHAMKFILGTSNNFNQ
ncbi:hypothetical protein [Parashewanella tropica]|uniref:hypothetical protein n=1 Tax=Parashewanella tropica TaxID=2547970 RepID=UPI001059381D|nr:hypothetical protein [Parashewanella tropica]